MTLLSPAAVPAAPSSHAPAILAASFEQRLKLARSHLTWPDITSADLTSVDVTWADLTWAEPTWTGGELHADVNQTFDLPVNACAIADAADGVETGRHCEKVSWLPFVNSYRTMVTAPRGYMRVIFEQGVLPELLPKPWPWVVLDGPPTN